jgi:hypothetical protein
MVILSTSSLVAGAKTKMAGHPEYMSYRSRNASCLYRSNGDNRYSIARRVPFSISTVTALAEARSIVSLSNRTVEWSS